MMSKKLVYSNAEQLLHAHDTCVRMTPMLAAAVSRAISGNVTAEQPAHEEVVFEMKDARVTVNVHVERK